MKNIIVREYLESLTESEELDYIFPILLEVMGFQIISTPRITKGLAQYGKDVVAIGNDGDGVRKRFYFELKAGADRNITTSNYGKTDGIRESLFEAKDRPCKDSSNPGFNDLPVKIVLVHNGTIHPSVKETFDGFIEREFPKPAQKVYFFGLFKIREKKHCPEFERWDIYQLTELFTQHLFNEYLLTDEQAVIHFKKVLLLINTPGNNLSDFYKLIQYIFDKANTNTPPGERKRLLLFETIKLVSFIVYHYAGENNNMEVAKKCVPYAILRLWGWVLENNLEKNTKLVAHFRQVLAILSRVFEDYFSRTMPVAKLKNGLLSEKGGRYEQVGYPLRSMEYIAYLIIHFHFQKSKLPEEGHLIEAHISDLAGIINNNDGTTRPLFDNHSIPICLVLNYFISNDRGHDAAIYLRNVLTSIQLGYDTFKRLPDGRNRVENVIQFVVYNRKSVYYEDRTSLLFGMLFQYMAILDMRHEYDGFKKFVNAAKIDVAIFVPYGDAELTRYVPENVHSHELNLFSHELFNEGYQAEIRVGEEFDSFKQKIFSKLPFEYSYRTNEAGFPYLTLLAHVHFKTPFFSNAWSKYVEKEHSAW